MSISATLIANQALARIGASRINNIDTGETTEAIQARTHYETTRDSLLQSHLWRFALARATLSEDTETPDFEYDHQYILPTDCLRVIGVYDTTNTYVVEGDRLLTDDDSVEIWYLKRITDPTQFSPLFIECLVLQLAMKLVPPLSEHPTLRRELQEEYLRLIMQVRTINLQETNTRGRADLDTWNDARTVGVE
jgi:hypothetical protein